MTVDSDMGDLSVRSYRRLRGRFLLCSRYNHSPTNHPDVGIDISMSLDNESGERPACSPPRGDENCSKYGKRTVYQRSIEMMDLLLTP